MMFQVSNEPHGYVVEAYLMDHDGGNRHWVPLRNFGDRQGDARDYMEIDCPELNDAQIAAVARMYRPNVKYKRVNKHRFAKIRTS